MTKLIPGKLYRSILYFTQWDASGKIWRRDARPGDVFMFVEQSTMPSQGSLPCYVLLNAKGQISVLVTRATPQLFLKEVEEQQ